MAAEEGPSIVIQALFAAIVLVVAISGFAALYTFWSGADAGLEELVKRVDFVLCGLDVPCEELGTNTAENVFFMTLHEDEYLMLFTSDDQELTSTSTYGLPPRTKTFNNPCEGACVCTQNAGEDTVPKRRCVDLRFPSGYTVTSFWSDDPAEDPVPAAPIFRHPASWQWLDDRSVIGIYMRYTPAGEGRGNLVFGPWSPELNTSGIPVP